MRQSILKMPGASVKHRRGRSLWLGLASVVLARLLPGRLPRLSRSDLKKHDYRVSAQGMGVRFTERVRDTFRFRWIKRAS